MTVGEAISELKKLPQDSQLHEQMNDPKGYTFATGERVEMFFNSKTSIVDVYASRAEFELELTQQHFRCFDREAGVSTCNSQCAACASGEAFTH